MPRIEGVEVYFSTSEGKLQEYTDPERALSESADRREKTCYIKATDGQEFTVTIDGVNHRYDPEAYDYLHFDLLIDGTSYDRDVVELGGPYIGGSLYRLGAGGAPWIHRGLHSNNGYRNQQVRRFTFATREIGCEVDEPHHNPNTVLGQITVKLVRFKSQGDRYSEKLTVGNATEENGGGRVHEKHIKGFDISHQVK